MSKLLIISSDTIDENMAGTGVRNWEIAHALASEHKVTLAAPNLSSLNSNRVEIVHYEYENGDLKPFTKDKDAIILQGMLLHFHPYLRELDIPIAVDLYVPFLLENLVWHDKDDWDIWIPEYEEFLRVQNELLRTGDFFYCASERQRDYWLGMLHAQKRLNPHTYRQDATLRKLIDVVPYGIPNDPPASDRPVLKGLHPKISKSDRLILWSGGLWDWLDPLTLINAMGQLIPKYPSLKLWFMGTKHPNPIVKGMTMPERAIALSKDLGLYEKNIFFGDWVPYQDRVNYLLEADLSVISHPGHIETRFSFRTRVLDCIWAGIPVIITAGDLFAEWVETEDLGYTIPPLDVPALCSAVEKMITSRFRYTFSPNFKDLREQLHWNNVTKRLSRFCNRPYFAHDKGHYLTEVERISRDKDTFHEKVVREKDAFLEQVVREKDEFTSQVIVEKDEFLNRVIEDKDNFLDQVIQEKDSYFNKSVQEKDKLLEKTVQEKDAQIEEKSLEIVERLIIIKENQDTIGRQGEVIHKKNSYIEEVLEENYRLLSKINRYQSSLPFRILYKFKRLFNIL